MRPYSELTDRVHGPVLVRGAAGYDEELAGFQTGAPHRPDVVVGAQDGADVAAAVAFAAAHEVPVAVHATGHGRGAGLEGGVVIGTRRMQGVRIYPDSGVAHIAAGARWAQVAVAAAEHGLAPLSGSFPAPSPRSGRSATSSAGAWDCWVAGTGGRPTTSARSSSSPRTAWPAAPPPTPSPSCSGRCAVAGSRSPW